MHARPIFLSHADLGPSPLPASPLQAYAKIRNHADRVGSRPMDKGMTMQLNGGCMKLHLDGAKIMTQKGQGNTFYLNPNDGNKLFPEERRCVVFNLAE